MATPYEIYEPETHPRPEPQRRADRSASQSFGCCGSAHTRQRWMVVSAICVAIWAVTGGGYFWPIWVMLGLGLPALLRRRC